MSIPTTKQVVAVHGDGHLRRIEKPLPPLEEGMVLIEVGASLVSPGSELKGGWQGLRAKQENPDADAKPRAIGYSNAGVVLAVGKGVKTVSEGDRVAAVGAGAAQHADFVVVAQNLVFRLPEGLSFEQASYTMLTATALHAIRRGTVEVGQYCAVAGLGMVGLLTARVAQIAGLYSIGWDMMPERLKMAREMGIDEVVEIGREDAAAKTKEFTRGMGLDVGVLAVGGDAERAFEGLLSSMKVSPDGHSEGTIVVVGGAEFPFYKHLTNVDIRRSSRTGPGYHDKAWERGLDYPPVFMRWTTRTNIELCLRWLAEGKIDVSRMTTHRVPFNEVEARTAEITANPQDILGMVFKMKNDA